MYKTGYLSYNGRLDRYEFFPKDGGEEIELHAGYCLDFWEGSAFSKKNGKWRASRIEYDPLAFEGTGDWYLAGTELIGADLHMLKVRICI